MEAIDLGLLVLRLAVGLTMAAHGAQKAFGWWGGPGFERWRGAITSMGFRPAALFAGVSTGAELVGGSLLALGLLTPFAAAVVVAQSIVIIGQAHWSRGFWNGGGGIEFPLALAAGALAIGLAGAGTVALDSVLGFAFGDAIRELLLALAVVGGLVALAVPRVGRRDVAAHA